VFVLTVREAASICFFFCTSLTAQSVSPWMKVGDATFGDNPNPTPGAAYLTVYLRAATAYQNSNWWTNFVERNRQAVLTVNLTGTVANVQVSQLKTSPGITLQKNKSPVDLGFAGVVVDHLPTTFSNLSMVVQVQKTAQDGLQSLMSAVSALTAAQPPVLPISQQAIGIANLGKSLADFLFREQLLVQMISSQNVLPEGSPLPPGVYACLAGDSEADYQQYLQGGIKWSGTQLSFNNSPVHNISYFIVEVGYTKRFFNSPLDVLSFGGEKPWVALYLVAQSEIPNINTAAEASKTVAVLQSHLSDALTFLNADPDYINAEKVDIENAVYQNINSAYQARLQALGISNVPAPPPPVAAVEPALPAQPAPPVLLRANDPIEIQQHTKALQQILLNARPMVPTSMPAK